MKHVVAIEQFADKKLLERLVKRAEEFRRMGAADYPAVLKHKMIATIFFEPSTRTRLSFEAAIQKLGARLISTENAGVSSSKVKGESLEDTIRTLNAYADGIVMRHPEAGSAERAAAVSGVPIFNAGDGPNQHPTQALLDFYSIYQAKHKINGLKIGFVGDLLYSRTIHSLLPLLALYQVDLVFMSPKSLEMPEKYLAPLNRAGVNYKIINNWAGELGGLDVLYMTRVQKERFASEADYNKVKDGFILNLKQVKQLPKGAIILHPLPRVNEIADEVDNDPRAYYFEQVKNGLFMRMALLDYIYSK